MAASARSKAITRGRRSASAAPSSTARARANFRADYADLQKAGLATELPPDPNALATALTTPTTLNPETLAAFMTEHTGASARTLAAIDGVLGRG